MADQVEAYDPTDDRYLTPAVYTPGEFDPEGDGSGMDPGRHDAYRAELDRYRERCNAV